MAINTKEYIQILKEVKSNYTGYFDFFNKFSDNDFEYIDVVRKTHIKYKKIMESRRMNPNWAYMNNEMVKNEHSEEFNMLVQEIHEYCGQYITPLFYSQEQYNRDQRLCVQYKTENGLDITKLIDL